MDFAGAYSAANLSYLWEGLLITLEIGAVSIVLSFLFGIIIAVLRYAKVPVISQFLTVWVQLIRNLPLLLLIFFTYFGLPMVLDLDWTPITSTIIALTVFESAMISEIIRGGLNSLPKGQTEAARSSGLNYFQTLRFILVPQALRKMVPPLVSQFISLLKDTSLATVIALEEFVRSGEVVYAQQTDWVFPILILMAVVFFVINYMLSFVASRLERRFNV